MSETAGAVPLAANILPRQLAVNIADKKFYTENAAGTVVDITPGITAAAVPNSSYRTILDSSGSHTAARVAGTYFLGQGDPLGISGTGTLYPPNVIYIAAADYPTVNGLTTKLRLRCQLYTNDISPFVGTFVFGLYPITRPAVSGGAGLAIYTLGTVVTGSTLTFTNPVADGLLNATGADFAIPADGHYVIGVVTNAAVAASAHVHTSASLQMRNA